MECFNGTLGTKLGTRLCVCVCISLRDVAPAPPDNFAFVVFISAEEAEMNICCAEEGSVVI